MKGTSDTVGHLAYIALVKPRGKKIIHNAFTVLRGKYPGPGIEGRQTTFSLLTHYVNVSEHIK